jgi:hypothetical protein
MASKADFQAFIDWTTGPYRLPEGSRGEKAVGALLLLRGGEMATVQERWTGVLKHSLSGGPLHDRFSGTLDRVRAPVSPAQVQVGLGTDRAAAGLSGAGIKPEFSEAAPMELSPEEHSPPGLKRILIGFEFGHTADFFELFLWWPAFRISK